MGASWKPTVDLCCPDWCFTECPACCDGLDNDYDGQGDYFYDDGCTCCCGYTESPEGIEPCGPCGSWILTSCDINGNEINQFCPGQRVYVKGFKLEADTTYRIWIQRDPVNEGWVLNVSEDPSGVHELVTTDADGSFIPIELWAIPSYATPTYDTFQVVPI
jgi:hypothetical protein